MAYIHVTGGKKLMGEVDIQGSKNASLPIIAATVLIDGVTRLDRCPRISDVFHMTNILEAIGCKTYWEGSSLIIDTSSLGTSTVPAEYVRKMRSSIIMMGALLGRTNEVTITYPGGCLIGARPIDFHIEAFKKMNISLEDVDGLIVCKTSKIIGTEISFKFPSVGATENTILAAVLASGKTIINNAAKEPEITDLCLFLNKAGAKISGYGTNQIVVEGVERLHEISYRISSDRIVTGTYIAAVAATGGHVKLGHTSCGILQGVIDLYRKIGCHIICDEDNIYVSATGKPRPVPFTKTEPYPGFPTDMQSQTMAVLMSSEGTSQISEEIFEGRYKIVDEFRKFGANIEIEDRLATIHGTPYLKGAKVYASELRGGAALVIAGLVAEGHTFIHNPGHIERGYENICRDLQELGAQIDYVN
ncbi:MAG: UDP-N-acetylglucosamine 1-carboxyvinyltransferase [Clostridiales bacterium]|nr:UDP-N-acetylglucosamine 1-carboxyvinyltransferase [Clostridiales bacterium]